ncbi:sodium:solute symporter family protein [Niabella drilacis]|uniref:Solute:Na+ symporter, SSS family n=1 Tax=Niabella drilacis (strain DSM 25811 / CCM 8410 / CCUG 62505 / LMG 26954 / E90) TaxID=1285928 RepID=A0A1G7A511_NIADE|nr:sodium:solute symporter family protein [Niabella drilacis]SDE09850.1 solute:Na+ symporter, SSS family [Niabella drilacis]
MKLALIDYAIIGIYFLFVIGIGFLLKKKIKTGNDFLMSNRNIPLWITSLAFISANLGAQEVLGMAANGAKYGLYTTHFYWLGAALAMIFLGIYMMPFYYGSKARSVPEYLKLRFDEKTRTFNALTFAVMTVFSSGVSLYALAMLMEVILGWDFNVSIWMAAGVVLAYTFLGGLTSAVYNEVLQFFLIVLGIAPLVFIGLDKAGGWEGIVQHVADAKLHVWKGLDDPAHNPMGVDLVSMVFGLGFVLAFGYWCTDFLVVQRAMISRNLNDARRTPIIAAVPKILMPVIVILPGLVILALQKQFQGFELPTAADGSPNYNMVLPTLLKNLYPNGILGVGITALIASFMSGMAGNVTAFNTVWTFDIYQAHIKKNAPEKHYLYVGKATTVVGILISVMTAYVARGYNSIMDLLQLVFSFVNAPLFATFALGMFWKRTTGHGAFWGLISGTLAAAVTHGLTVAEGKGGWLGQVHHFFSGTSQAFTIAWISFVACFMITALVSLVTQPKPEAALKGLVYSLTPRQHDRSKVWYKNPLWLGILVLAATIVLNIIFF